MRSSATGSGSPDARTTEGDVTQVEAVFGARKELRKAINDLMAEGVPTNTIHVYLVDGAGNRRRELSVESESGALKGALIGAGLGAAVGLVIVALVLGGAFGPASVDLFGMGSVLGGVRAVAMGAAAGVPLGALLGMGHWQGARKVPDADFDRFRASVVVETHTQSDLARRILEKAGASDVTG